MPHDGDEFEWLSDYMVSVMKSPTWVTPISEFIDQRCELFDDPQEEHELVHTSCHTEFKQLVNDLLASHLLEVCVQPEDFERFCDRGFAVQTRLHRALVEQLLSVDDFLAFKAMMAKHSAELCREAITCEMLEEDPEPISPTRLMAESVVATSIEEGLRSRDSEWQLYEDQLCKAMLESQNNQESYEAQLRCEEAELEQVIALSLQLEGERLRQLSQEEVSLAPSPELPAPLVPAPPAVPARLGSLSSPLCLLPPKLVPAPAPKMVEVEIHPPAQRRGASVWGFTSAPLCPAPPQLPQDPAALPGPAAPPAAPAVPPRVVGFTSSPLCYRPPAPKPPLVPAEPGAAPGAPGPESPESLAPAAPVRGALQRLPTVELDDMRCNLDLWRKRAERAFVARPVVQSGSSAQAAPAGPTEEERRQRAEHLARQRDRLKQKRQRERDQQMDHFQRSRGGGSAIAAGLDRAAARAAGYSEGRRLVAATSPGARIAGPSAPPMENTLAAAERMRQALTLQLRQTLMRTTVSDAGVLDGQLSHLELRKGSG